MHKQWVGDVSDMITGMKQSEAAGQAGALTLAMLQASYAAIVRIGRRFEAVCPAEGNTDDAVTALGKLEDLYEQCVSELEDAKAGLDECRENGFQDDLAYGELMVTKLGLTQLTKQFDIATGLRRTGSGAVSVPAQGRQACRISRALKKQHVDLRRHQWQCE